MKRGPKPKPDERKARLGNPGKRPLAAAPEETETPAAEAPEAALPQVEVSAEVPEGLSERGAHFWREYTKHRRSLGWIKDSDLQGLKRLCEWSAIWWQAREEVERVGTHYETVGMNGQLLFRPHPAFNAMRVAEDRCQDLEDRMGFNPAARQRIGSQLAAGGLRQPAMPGMEASEPAPEEPAGQPAPAGSGSALGVLNRGRALH